MTYDVVVIGAGVMGCGVALRLAQAGKRVLVLERSIPGAEASSAAGGILGPQAESDAPGPLLDLGLRSRELYPALAQELRELTGVDIGFRRCGVLKVAQTPAGLEKLEGRAGWQAASGMKAERLDRAQVLALEPALTGPLLGGLWLPDEGQVDPKLLAAALSIAAQKAGATFQTRAVRRVHIDDGRARGVELEDGVVESDAVVLAAGAWSSLVPGGAEALAVKPARGQMVQLETRPPALARIVFTEKGYLVPRPDGRLLLGSTLEFVGYAKHVTAGGLHGILSMALEVAPGLASAPVVETWAGFRPFTPDAAPLLGEGPLPGLFFATGHHRNGILLAPVTAEVVSQAVLRKPPSVGLLPFRPDRSFQS
jgi:glycine oxidase